jgi:hypothetical protein
METPANYSIYEKVPRPGQLVMVANPSGRCVGFLDPERGWCDVRDGLTIEEVESWSPLNIGHSQMQESAQALASNPARLPGSPLPT